MDELLKKLLEAEVLTEETKTELKTAFDTQLSEAIKQAQADAKATVTAELNEQWITERDTLIEALDSRVSEALKDELTELRADIERFRDLEAEHAEKLVEAKEMMAKTLKSDLAQLIEKLDTFLEVRLTVELDELREDLEVVKKNDFGKRVFEAFVAEFRKHYTADDSIESRLGETEQQLEVATKALKEAKDRAATLERQIKLEKVLAPLSGRTKEVMEAILKTVDTNSLEDAYKTYVGRVLKETTSEKEDTVLAEGDKKQKQSQPSGVTKTGNDEEMLEEQTKFAKQDAQLSQPVITAEDRIRLRRVAGLQ